MNKSISSDVLSSNLNLPTVSGAYRGRLNKSVDAVTVVPAGTHLIPTLFPIVIGDGYTVMQQRRTDFPLSLGMVTVVPAGTPRKRKYMVTVVPAGTPRIATAGLSFERFRKSSFSRLHFKM